MGHQPDLKYSQTFVLYINSFWILLLTVISFLLSGRKTSLRYLFWVHKRRTCFPLRKHGPVLHTSRVLWKFALQQHLLLQFEISFSQLFLCTINGIYSASSKAHVRLRCELPFVVVKQLQDHTFIHHWPSSQLEIHWREEKVSYKKPNWSALRVFAAQALTKSP